jgi:hypothetical protein
MQNPARMSTQPQQDGRLSGREPEPIRIIVEPDKPSRNLHSGPTRLEKKFSELVNILKYK